MTNEPLRDESEWVDFDKWIDYGRSSGWIGFTAENSARSTANQDELYYNLSYSDMRNHLLAITKQMCARRDDNAILPNQLATAHHALSYDSHDNLNDSDESLSGRPREGPMPSMLVGLEKYSKQERELADLRALKHDTIVALKAALESLSARALI